MQSTATTVVAVLCAIPGCLAAAYALHLVALAIAAGFYRQERHGCPPVSRLMVLVPAHDEALLITRCIDSLREQTYPTGLYAVLVIADNCSDDTAMLARAAGADAVMTRDVPELRSKGHALRWAMDQILPSATAPDAVVIVDADSVAAPDFLTRLVEPFEAGARAVQCDSVIESDGRGQAALREAAFLLATRVRSAGRAVLGMSGHLFGNGMLLSSDLLRARPWNAYSSAEDVEYSLNLRAGGVRIAFAGAAQLRSPAAPTAEASATQQLRWLG
ncbi:MAG: glycosyltransferase family 2 protein, partial [Trebonia sp.]